MKAAVISFPQENGADLRAEVREDQFLSRGDLVGAARDAADRSALRVLAQARELFRTASWDEMVSLLYPVAERVPEVMGTDHEAAVRGNVAFALSQREKFDEALAELAICVDREPENFRFHSSLAYTAYNSLYAAKNRKIFLHGTLKKERIALASDHMDTAVRLRPDSIANVYRAGMLKSEIEGKPDLGLPCFLRAVSVWEGKSPEEAEAMRHERKHYIKSLYHAAGCLCDTGSLSRALELIGRCIGEDRESDHVGAVFKHFLRGKILFGMARHDEADAELDESWHRRGEDPAEYVLELKARNLLVAGKPEKALPVIRTVPKFRKRPYCRWTEADILCALGQYGDAADVLMENMDRDRRSRHKTLIRLVKIDYLHQRYADAAKRAAEANRFFQEAWGKTYADGVFWEALSLARLGDTATAGSLYHELETRFPWHHGLPGLKQLLDQPAS